MLQSHVYSVKVINSQKKSDDIVHKLPFNGKFSSLSHLKDILHTNFPDQYTSQNQVGYIQPGHGARGRQHWLNNDANIQEMYLECTGKREIMLWFLENKAITSSPDELPSTSKRPRITDAPTSKKSELLSQKMSEVDEIVSTLTKKHSKSYTIEQIRAWAHMIQMDKHESYDEAPDKPFFRHKRANLKQSTDKDPTMNRIELRSQCMDQLQKWHDLLNKQIISQEQYDELRDKIMVDIQKL